MSRKRRYRRDPLAKDRAELAAAAAANPKPLDLAPTEIEARMAKIIRDRLSNGETISLEDFRLAALPVKEIQPRFKRVLAAVQNELAMGGT